MPAKTLIGLWFLAFTYFILIMAMGTSISRCVSYLKCHGLRATIRRAAVSVRRTLSEGRMVLFYCDLSAQRSTTCDLPSGVSVERVRSRHQLRSADLLKMTSFWSPKLACRNIKERFGAGASLWLVRNQENLLGYGWTLRGCTVEPHYFELGPDDVHLFDFYVFPAYRGRRMNPLLVRFILRSLATEYQGRAFIEAAEWNQAQLASLTQTPFQRLGSARKIPILGHALVWWSGREAREQASKHELRTRLLPPLAK